MENNSDPSFRGFRRKQGMGEKIKNSIAMGDKKTFHEYAEEFGVSEKKVRSILNRINGKEPIYWPVDGVYGGAIEKREQGKLVNILEKEEYVRQVVNRHDKNRLSPRIQRFGLLLDRVATKYPHLIDFLVNFLVDKATQLLAFKESLKGHANPKLTNSENKTR